MFKYFIGISISTIALNCALYSFQLISKTVTRESVKLKNIQVLSNIKYNLQRDIGYAGFLGCSKQKASDFLVINIGSYNNSAITVELLNVMHKVWRYGSFNNNLDDLGANLYVTDCITQMPYTWGLNYHDNAIVFATVKIKYYLQNSSLYRKVGNQPAMAIADRVKKFSVIRLADVINIYIQFTDNTKCKIVVEATV